MPGPINKVHIDYMRENVGEAPRFDPSSPEGPQVQQWKEWSYLTRNLDSLESTVVSEKANREVAKIFKDNPYA